MGAEYCDQPICLSACLSVREHIYGTARPIFTKFCVRIPCGCGSVFFRRRCDMLCTSGFMADVTFGRNGPYGETWRLNRYTTIPRVALRDRGGVWCLWMPCFLLQIVDMYKYGVAVRRPWQLRRQQRRAAVELSGMSSRSVPMSTSQALHPAVTDLRRHPTLRIRSRRTATALWVHMPTCIYIVIQKTAPTQYIRLCSSLTVRLNITIFCCNVRPANVIQQVTVCARNVHQELWHKHKDEYATVRLRYRWCADRVHPTRRRYVLAAHWCPSRISRRKMRTPAAGGTRIRLLHSEPLTSSNIS